MCPKRNTERTSKTALTHNKTKTFVIFFIQIDVDNAKYNKRTQEKWIFDWSRVCRSASTGNFKT